MTTGHAVQKVIRTGLMFGLASGPLGELIQAALPDDLLFLVFNAAESSFVKCKRVRASQQGASARPFPFSIILFQLPRFEMRAPPPEIFRRDAMKRGEG